MFLRVIIIGTVLGAVASKFGDSHDAVHEFTPEIINSSRDCVNTNQWALVENVDNRDYVTFYKSSETVLLTEGSLELYVHVKTDMKAKLLLVISNENDEETSINYDYNRSGQESEINWCKLMIPIKYRGFTYINLLGYVEDNENVLMDSLYYESEIYKITHDNNDEAIILYIQEHVISNTDATKIEETKENEIMKILITEDKKSNNGNTREDTDNDIDHQGNNNGLLGTWVIVLIVVVAVTVISLVAVGAYQLGLSKGLAKNPTYIEDVEPARVVTIPRVRGVTDSPIGELM